MQIDNCGGYVGKMLEIYSSTIEMNRRSGEKINDDLEEKLDDELFKAYQFLLKIAGATSQKEKIMSESLESLKQLLQMGRVEASSISNIATVISSEVIKNNGISINNSKDNVVLNLQISSIKEEALINTICTTKMEELHNETFNKAKAGDLKSVVVLDLINKASKYMINSESLNPKGKELGALVLVSRLLATNSPEAIEMAENLVRHFGLQNIKEGNQINDTLIRERISEKKPNLNIEQIAQKGEEIVVKDKDRVLRKNTGSFKSDFESATRISQANKFMRFFKKAIENGDDNLLNQLVSQNYDLAKLALERQNSVYEQYIQGKREESSSFKAVRMKLGESLSKVQAPKSQEDKENQIR